MNEMGAAGDLEPSPIASPRQVRDVVMASSKHWALFASVHRNGQWDEHRLAGARLGRVGVSLDCTVMHGWRAKVHVGHFHVEFGRALSNEHWRRKAFWDHVMPPYAVAKLTQSLKDVDSGRGYRWDPRSQGRDVPLATWREDDPIQPKGWHYDGRRWVLNDNGWFRDRGGYWRYNEPGDPGWTQREDGGWKYVAAAECDLPVDDAASPTIESTSRPDAPA